MSKLEYVVKLLKSERRIKNRDTSEEVKSFHLAERATLLKERPREWVASGADGIIAFGKTRRERWTRRTA